MFPNDNELEAQFTFESNGSPVDDDLPFHILILGDWNGGNSDKKLDERRPVSIDRDNFDEIMRRFDVALRLELPDLFRDDLVLRFTSLDDFHPDNLYRQLPVFGELRELRRKLLDHNSFDQAAREVRPWINNSAFEPAAARSADQDSDAVTDTSENLLDAILSQSNSSAVPSAQSKSVPDSAIGRLISQIVAPHLIKVDETEQMQLVAAVDAAIGGLMRQILHHPKFQKLEASWRGLYFLVRRVETNRDMKIFVFNVTHNELIADLKENESLTQSAFYRLIEAENGFEIPDEGWSLICADYTFSLNVEDVAALMRTAKICSSARISFISHLISPFFDLHTIENALSNGEADFDLVKADKLWSTLRSIPESQYLALSPNRFLARLPYGSQTDEIESFEFEETSEEFGVNDLVWSNPSFIIATLLASKYTNFGWSERMFTDLEISGLPLYFYQRDGEKMSVACAEFVLTESKLAELLNQGLLPLVTYRHSDKIRLARLNSIAGSALRLQGK